MARPTKPRNDPCQINFRTEKRLKSLARIANLSDTDLWELGLKTTLGVKSIYTDEIIKELIRCERQKIQESEERIEQLIVHLKSFGGIYSENPVS
jgi:hypothetical protein